MPQTITVHNDSNLVLQETLGMYADEAYTNAKKLTDTGITSGNPQIDTAGETYIGQMRWMKPLTPTIEIISLTDNTDGTPTNTDSAYLNYVKSVRATGAEKLNMAKVVTQQDGLAKMARDFVETRTQDESNALLSILKGVALSEALVGAASGGTGAGLGGQTWADTDTGDYGFYVELGSKLIIDASTIAQGAQRAQGFLDAIGMAWKDYEPEWAYLVTSPKVMASLRAANLVDQSRVQDANVEFETIFNGKFRLISTRSTTRFLGTEITKLNTGGGDDISNAGETSFIVLPGAIAKENLIIDEDVEITRKGSSYRGGGKTDIWYRWGYVMHPAGYDWVGSTTTFASDATYSGCNDVDSVGLPLLDANIAIGTATGIWKRKATSALSLGILPVFHD